jgi:hypothetical protein
LYLKTSAKKKTIECENIFKQLLTKLNEAGSTHFGACESSCIVTGPSLTKLTYMDMELEISKVWYSQEKYMKQKLEQTVKERNWARYYLHHCSKYTIYTTGS